MLKGLRTPIAEVFGRAEALPALSARAADIEVVYDVATAAGVIVSVEMPAHTLAFEVSAENEGEASALLRYVAVPAGTTVNAALLDAEAFRRRVPAGAQLVETRAVAAGDLLVFQVSAAARVTVHAHIGA